MKKFSAAEDVSIMWVALYSIFVIWSYLLDYPTDIKQFALVSVIPPVVMFVAAALGIRLAAGIVQVFILLTARPSLVRRDMIFLMLSVLLNKPGITDSSKEEVKKKVIKGKAIYPHKACRAYSKQNLICMVVLVVTAFSLNKWSPDVSGTFTLGAASLLIAAATLYTAKMIICYLRLAFRFNADPLTLFAISVERGMLKDTYADVLLKDVSVLSDFCRSLGKNPTRIRFYAQWLEDLPEPETAAAECFRSVSKFYDVPNLTDREIKIWKTESAKLREEQHRNMYKLLALFRKYKVIELDETSENKPT